MKKRIIAVGSVTYAMKAKRILQRIRIRTKLVKIDANKSKSGCTHGLEFDEEDFYSVIMELRNQGIHYSTYSD